MNTSRLRELVDLLLDREKQQAIQQILNELNQALSQLISQPQNANFQTQFAQTVDKLNAATQALRASFEPAQIPLLQEIGADKYFIYDFAEDLANSIRANPLTPAVTQQKLSEFLTQRQSYLDLITRLHDSLEALSIRKSTLQPGDAEIGFLLPRSLFNNRLDPLIKELRDILRIIRAFSEVTLGVIEEVEVRDISTTDPMFFLHFNPTVIAAIGGAVAWALNTWRQVEEIRRVRAETRKSNVLTEKEATDVFDKKINEKIETAIDAKVNELAKDDDKPGRAKEQRIDLKWALESIMAHVERGMIVEVRFVSPPAKAAVEGEPETGRVSDPFKSLGEVAPQLTFPKMEGPPILKLPQPPPAHDPRNE